MSQHRYLLSEDRIPRAWFNISADMPNGASPRAASRHP